MEAANVHPRTKEASPGPAGEGRTDEILSGWRKHVGMLDDRLFMLRLAHDGLTPEEFAARIEDWSSDAATLPLHEADLDTSPPPVHGSATQVQARDRAGQAWSEEEKALAPFLALVAPWMEHAEAELRSGIGRLAGEHPDRVDLDALQASCRDSLWHAPLKMLSRAAVVELHRDAQDGRDGDTRYSDFLESCRHAEGRTRFFERYPLLLPLVRQRLRQTRRALLEVVGRVLSDAQLIQDHFGRDADTPWVLSAVRLGLGDHHIDGRTVARLDFAPGTTLIYKPRSLGLEVAYFNLVDWLNATGLTPDQHVVATIDRGDYGYMAYVGHLALDEPAQVERYYARLGGMIALMYLLNGTDLHYENIVAHGEYPCAIDLETLMHPMLPSLDNPRAHRSGVQDSVLWGLLLPTWNPGRRPGALDISGISVMPERIRARVPVDAGTSRLRYEVREVAFARSANAPTLGDEPQPAHRHAAHIADGFRRTYAQVLRHRRELASEDGPLSRFKGLTSRVVLRGTQVYESLRSALLHPSTLARRVDAERLLERLWIQINVYPAMAPCVAAERAALWRGDVPLFHVRTDETTVRDCFNTPLAPLFVHSGWSELKRRLRMLGPRDMLRQARVVEHSARALRPAAERRTWPLTAYAAGGAGAPVAETTQRMVSCARRLAHYLLDSSFRSGPDILLLQNAFSEDAHYAMKAVDWDLYEGLSGVALFLAQVDHVAGDPRARRGAEKMLATARRMVDSQAGWTTGAFNGIAGWMYTLYSLGRLWNRPALEEEALRWLPGLIEELPNDRGYDVIGGAAGAMWVLLRMHRVANDERLLDAAQRCAHHLLDHSIAAGPGIAWPMPAFGGALMTGLSHGASGIAVPLAWLGELTGNARFTQAAQAALDFEHASFDPALRVWRDARPDRSSPDGRAGSIHAWCHGAPGIGLARLNLPRSFHSARWRHEVEASIQATLEFGLGGSHCLCHGDLGNLELLISAASDPRFGHLAAPWQHHAAQVLVRVEHEPRCGSHTHTELLGLMSGLAGIGYGLLRCAAPARVPSVLALELPGA